MFWQWDFDCTTVGPHRSLPHTIHKSCHEFGVPVRRRRRNRAVRAELYRTYPLTQSPYERVEQPERVEQALTPAYDLGINLAGATALRELNDQLRGDHRVEISQPATADGAAPARRKP